MQKLQKKLLKIILLDGCGHTTDGKKDILRKHL